MIIVDTSVAIKWLRSDEEGHKDAMLLYKNHIESTEKIIVPALFYIEAANALATNKFLSDDDISEGMEFLFEARFTEQTVTQKMLVEAAILAKKHHTSVYDMLYAVIAKMKKAMLVTADEKFVKNVNFSFIKLL